MLAHSHAKHTFLVPILMLGMCHVAASQSSAPEGSKAPARSALKLKSVELDNKYTIQVPDYFTVHQISDRIAAAPTYSFSAAQPHYTTIQVFVLPFFLTFPFIDQAIAPVEGLLVRSDFTNNAEDKRIYILYPARVFRLYDDFHEVPE